uniref:25S rRNA (uridine-N(3))-methyltransferase BMT5-like domain-containing protein n=1 Tax=Quercus lobata TaxID=97700 RepID=A0A7N2LJR9_QUELO
MSYYYQNEEWEVDADEEEEEEEKWVKNYSSNHQILLVGEGDFSFSLSLAHSFGSASNILASSLDPYDVLMENYEDAKWNLENLEKLGASLLHGVDATKLKLHSDLRGRKFDRIIFNFLMQGTMEMKAHTRVIKMHRNLVHGFFSSARGMLRADGEIHVNHKNYCSILPLEYKGTCFKEMQWSPSLNFTSRVGHLTIMERISQNLSLPLTSSAGNLFSRMIDGYLSNPTETFGGINCDLSYSIHERSPDFGRDFAAMPGRTLNGDPICFA